MGDSFMRIIKYLFVFICFFMFNTCFVYALSCDEEDTASLKVLAKNVNVSYDFIEQAPAENGIISEKYLVTIQGIVEGISVSVDEGNISNRVYKVSDLKDGKIEIETFRSKLTINVYSSECYTLLHTIDIKLPRYNTYANTEECKKLAKYNLDICKEWYDGATSVELIEEAMNKYFGDSSSENGHDINYYLTHYWYVFGIVGILLFVAIIFIIYRVHKRSVLE